MLMSSLKRKQEEEFSLTLGKRQSRARSVSDFIFLVSGYEGGRPVLSLVASTLTVLFGRCKPYVGIARSACGAEIPR